jgi:protein phosphatase
MVSILEAAGKSDVGQVRELNEDTFFVKVLQSSEDQPLGLFIVADGMGAYEGGELASEWAMKTIRDHLQSLFLPLDPQKTAKLGTGELGNLTAPGIEPTQRIVDFTMEARLQEAIQRANTVVRRIAQARPKDAGSSGTTITMAVVQGSMGYVANVGDSRTYLLSDGRLTAITRDHSLVASLVEAGQLEPDQVYSHPQRNLIYRALGDKPQVEVDVFYRPLRPGDQLLLCSDGLWEMVREPELTRILQNAASPAAACEALVDAANQAGGKDNISAVVVWTT